MILTIAVIAFTWVLYNLNGDFSPYHDTWVNVLTAESLLRDGDILLSPEEAHELMVWRVVGETTSQDVALTAYDENIARLRNTGTLRLEGTEVILRESQFPGLYANIFGSGVGIASAPFFAVARWIVGPQAWEPKHAWLTSKWISSGFSAVSVGFIFLAARVISTRLIALITAAVYGAGTGIFSISSQSLFQHSPSQCFLAIGLFLFVGGRGRLLWLSAAGVALAAAVWCRPTSVMLVTVIAAYLLLFHRRAAKIFIISGLPLGLALMWHNYYCFGSPWKFGQTELANVATETTGSPEIFQTPLLYGAVAHLLSPSRGLFVFSPVLLFCLWGIWRSWRLPGLVCLRPLSIGLLGMWLIEFKHYDWWGGWSYGYRHLVDTTTVLVLFLPPALESMGKRKGLWAIFALMAFYSIGVQVIGAFAYDMAGWNNRQAEIVPTEQGTETRLLDDHDFIRAGLHPGRYVYLDVDLPENRHRLWSWTDSEIWYYFNGFSSSRKLRRYLADKELLGVPERRMETYVELARAFERVGDPESAKHWFEQAEQLKQQATASERK